MIKGEYRQLAKVMKSGLEHLRCYEYFTRRQTTDVVECLLRMHNVEATNPLDFVYGVLGITRFPSKPMSVAAWANANDRESFLPIDYSIDIEVLWCILSRVLLLQGGFNLLAKFKVNHRIEPEGEEPKLPTWAIDWRLTAQTFELYLSFLRTFPDLAIKLKNAWDGVVLEKTLSNRGPGFEGRRYKLLPGAEVPVSHLKFCNENIQGQQDDFTKLNLCGRMIKRSSVHITEHTVEIKEMHGKKTLGKWHVASSLHQDDIAVRIHAFSRSSSVNGKSPKLWLLRPVRGDQFKLIACLPGCYRFEYDGPRQLYSKGDIMFSLRAKRPELFQMWVLREDVGEADRKWTHIMARPEVEFYSLEWGKDDGLYNPEALFIIV